MLTPQQAQQAADTVPLARAVARKLSYRLFSLSDELEGWALEGVCHLATTWDPTKATWPAYVRWKLPLWVLDQARTYQHTRRHVSYRDIHLVDITTLDEDDEIPSPTCDPAEHVADLDEARRTWAALTDRQRTILTCTLHGDTLAEAGAHLGVSESRACQIRTQAHRDLAA